MLPTTVEQAHIDGDHLIAVGHAHAITAYTIDLEAERSFARCRLMDLLAGPAGLLAVCFGLWCVCLALVATDWTSRGELGLVLAVLLMA